MDDVCAVVGCMNKRRSRGKSGRRYTQCAYHKRLHKGMFDECGRLKHSRCKKLFITPTPLTSEANNKEV